MSSEYTAAGDELAAVSACRRCGQWIAWVETAKGKKLPLDPEPAESPFEGNFVLRGGVAYYVNDEYRMQQFDRWGERLSGSEPIYVAHFATCPAAAE